MMWGRTRVVVGTAAGMSVVAAALIAGSGAVAAPGRTQRLLTVPPLPASALARANRGPRRATTAAAHEKRVASRSRFEDTTGSKARTLAMKTFDSALDAPAFDASKPSATLTTVPGQRNMVGPRAVIARDAKSGKRVLVNSTMPLSVPVGGGERALVDLSLHPDGGRFKPTRAAVPVTISGKDGAVDFLGQNFKIGLEGAASSSRMQSSERQLFFADVQTDSDYAVRVEPGGAESFVQIRSRRSPESYRLKVDMPAGAHLERARTKHPIPNDPPKAIAIVQGDRTLGYVSPASTIDAEHTEVPTTTTIDGDSIVITVRHRAADVMYPLLTDPQYYTQNSSCSNGFSGWYWSEVYIPGYSHFGSATCNPAYAQGLYQSMPTNTVFKTGQQARFRFQSPSGSYISDATFGNIANYDPFYNYIYTGIANPPFTAWYSNVNAYNPLNGASVGNPFLASYAFQGQILDTCFTPRCAGPAGEDGDVAAIGIFPGNQVNNAVFPGAHNPHNTMGWANVSLGDTHPPSFSSAAPQNVGWRDDGSVGHTIYPSINDYGLGAYAIGLSGGTQGFQNRFATCNYSPQPAQAPCPSSFGTSLSYTLDEGTNTLRLDGNDLVNNYAPSQSWTERIDRTPPPTPVLSGPLWDARNGFVGPDADILLHINATDGDASSATSQRSGVASVTVKIDDQPFAGGSPTQQCARPEGSCSFSGDVSLPASQLAGLGAGPHRVSVTATDVLGHAGPAQTFTFSVDGVNPSITTGGSLGALADLEPRPLTDTSYRLLAEARDNVVLATDSGDGDDDPSLAVPAGSGIQDVVIRLDGQPQPTTSVACVDDPACEQAQSWNWDTTTVANGIHTITVTAADRVGNQYVENFDVDVEHAPDQPPRINSNIRRRVTGASVGDRLGASVTALGDINGDGLADYGIGAPGGSAAGRLTSGVAYILLGSQDSTPIDLSIAGNAAVRQISGSTSGALCGASVAAAGDVNGDGLADMLVGCPGVSGTGSLAATTGRVYVVFGRSNPQDVDLASIGTAGFTINGPSDPAAVGVPLLMPRPSVFGEHLQSAPLNEGRLSQDVNGDGLADLVIGDSDVPSGGLTASGAAYVIYGKTTTTPIDVTSLGNSGFVITGARQAGLAGYSAAITADLDGDTLADVIVGAPGQNTAIRGEAYVVKGSTSAAAVDLGSSSGRAVALTSNQPGDRFGVNVAALGDTNLDTKPDIAIGTSSGAYVLRDIPTTSRQVSANDGFQVSGPTNAPGASSTDVPAAPIAPVGDVDGDQREDLIVGYPDVAGPRAALIESPESSRNLAVTALPGQRGDTLAAGAQNDRSGAAVSGNTYQGHVRITENAQTILGAPAASPGLRLSAGDVYVLGEPAPSGPGPATDPSDGPDDDGTTTTGRAAQSLALPSRLHVEVDPTTTQWATVRQQPNSLVIGNAKNKASVDVNQKPYNTVRDGKRVSYYFGKLAGNVRFCGWLDAKSVTQAGATSVAKFKCNTTHIKERRFAKMISCEDCSDGPEFPLRAGVNASGQAVDQNGLPMPSTVPVYRNVRPYLGAGEAPHSLVGSVPIGTVAAPTKVKWRYTTAGQGFVLIKSATAFTKNDQWGFIEARFLPTLNGPNGLCQGKTPVRPAKAPHKYWPDVCSIPAYPGPR